MELAILVIILLGISFLMSGLESAILSMSPARLRHLAKEGVRRAQFLERQLARKEQLLASILVVNATSNLLAFVLITAKIVTWLGPWGYLISFVVALPIYLIWLEAFPKALFKGAPIRTLMASIFVLGLLSFTVRPVIALLVVPSRWLGNRFHGSEEPQITPGESRAEFRALTEILERKGALAPQESEMIQGVLDFQQAKVGEVMIPLSRVTSIPQEMPVETVISLGRETQFDQFPVMAASGDLVGLIDVLELLREEASGRTVESYRQDLIHSLPTDSAIGLIRRLRRAGHLIAAVYNASNRPIGIVSIEDMVGRLTLADATRSAASR